MMREGNVFCLSVHKGCPCGHYQSHLIIQPPPPSLACPFARHATSLHSPHLPHWPLVHVQFCSTWTSHGPSLSPTPAMFKFVQYEASGSYPTLMLSCFLCEWTIYQILNLETVYYFLILGKHRRVWWGQIMGKKVTTPLINKTLISYRNR